MSQRAKLGAKEVAAKVAGSFNTVRLLLRRVEEDGVTLTLLNRRGGARPNSFALDSSTGKVKISTGTAEVSPEMRHLFIKGCFAISVAVCIFANIILKAGITWNSPKPEELRWVAPIQLLLFGSLFSFGGRELWCFYAQAWHDPKNFDGKFVTRMKFPSTFAGIIFLGSIALPIFTQCDNGGHIVWCGFVLSVVILLKGLVAPLVAAAALSLASVALLSDESAHIPLIMYAVKAFTGEVNIVIEYVATIVLVVGSLGSVFSDSYDS